jgi:hypothetical protein
MATQLVDSFTTTSTAARSAYAANWLAQTFTASKNYTLVSVKLLMYRTGTVSTLTVSIRNTTSNLPSGTDLAVGTLDVSGLTTVSPGTMVEVAMTVPVALTSGQVYSIVCRSDGADSSNLLAWRRVSVGGYADGRVCTSTNSGSSWSGSTDDFIFETYETASVTHELAGSIACVISESGVANQNSILSGEMTSLFSVIAGLTTSGGIVGAINSVITVSGRIRKLFKKDTTAPIKRLVAAGANQIWYEIL